MPISDENEHNREHMFAFISGVTSEHVGELFDVLSRWLDVVEDHSDSSTSMTPRLLTAAVLEQYGSVVSQKITKSFKALVQCDIDLKHAIDESKAETPKSRIQVTKYIQDLNKKLVDMNIELTRTRSIMHYLSESANVLVNKISPFEDYVNARFKDWEDKHEKHPLRALRTLKKNFRNLDGFREKI
jgi:hypothetical protein